MCTFSSFCQSFCLGDIESTWVRLIIDIFIFAYAFGAMAIAADYMCNSLETLCQRWRLPEDVAGATFMALGNAMPEICVNAISTARQVMDGRNASTRTHEQGGAEMLGVGAIVGSGLIALLIIPGICAIFSPQGALTLRRKPLGRDLAAYLAAIVVLIHVLARNEATEWHSIFYFLIYGAYLAFMIGARLRHVPALEEEVFDRGSVCGSESSARFGILQHLHPMDGFAQESEVETERGMLRPTPILPDISNAALDEAPVGNENFNVPREHANENSDVTHPDARQARKGNTKKHENTETKIRSGNEVNLQEPLVSWRRNVVKTLSSLWAPVKHLCKWTIPDCELGHSQENLYLVGFLVSFAYIAVFSFAITTGANSIIETTSKGKSSTMLGVWGILLVSVGAEIPDAIQAVTVAKRGHGSMAASSCIGSQVCNLCMGFGLPWFVASVMGHAVVFAGDVFLFAASVCLLTIVVVFCLLSFGITLLKNQSEVIVRGQEARLLLSTYACIVIFLIALCVAL